MFEEIFGETVNITEWVLLVLATIVIIGPLLAERFRLPGMIGLVLGGLVLGPYGLHLLAEGSLDAIGGIGLLLLMFMAGAELDLNLFQRYRSAAIGFGLLTFILPFVLSVLGGLAIDLTPLAALLMGSVWASHTLVAYPTVRQSGLSGNKAVATAVGATVLTDTLALLVLAVVANVAGSQEGGGGSPVWLSVRLILGLGILAFYCLWVLPRLGRWFFAGPGQSQILRFVFIIGTLSSAGLLAVFMGIEGLVGAFFAGLGLNRLIPNSGHLMDRVEFFSSSLFVPAFLISVGMLINPLVLFNWQTLLIALVFLGGLAAGKLAAAWLAGRRYHFSPAEVGLMFSLTVAQAAATLASTLVGYDLGLFGEQIVNAVLLVVLVSLLLSSIGTLRQSKQVEPEAVVLKPLGSRVIVPVIPSPNLEQLMAIAADLAYSDAGIVLPVAVVPEHAVSTMHADTEAWLARAEAFGTAAAADVQGVMRIDEALHTGVIRELVARQGSIILLESSPRPRAQELLFGSTIDRLGANSPVPAVAATLSPHPAGRIILLPGQDQNNTGYRVDLQVAADIMRHIHQSRRLPVIVFAIDGVLPDDLALPEDTTILNVPADLAAMRPHVQPGDIVIVPAAVVQRFLRSASFRFAGAEPAFTLLVAAGPYRLHLTTAAGNQEGEQIINLGVRELNAPGS